jgi:hypothetical protein
MVINQFHACGDILFIEPICRHIWTTTGKKPILPVRDHLMWFADYIDSADFVPMSKFKLDYESMETSNPDYLPLRFAAQIINKKPADYHLDYADQMPAKYQLAGLPLELWKTLQWRHYFDRCKGLFAALDLSSDQDYIFVNENSQAGKVEINPANPNNYRIVKMREVPGFTLLDWTPIMLLAKEHHHVSTSTFYMLEGLKDMHDKNIPIYLYPRPNLDGLQGISKLNPSFKYKKCELV